MHSISAPALKMKTCTKFSDAEMVKLIQSQSKAGAEALYDQYKPVLFLTIIRIVCRKDAAEIILEKSFVQIRATIALFDEQEKPLLTWMLNIAKKAAQESKNLKL